MGDNGGLIVMCSRTDLMWENERKLKAEILSAGKNKPASLLFILSFFLLPFFSTSLRYDAVQFSFTFPLLLLSFFLCFFKHS